MAGGSCGTSKIPAQVQFTLSMILGTLLLYLLYIYEPISFSYAVRDSRPPPRPDPVAQASLTMELHPEEHRHRENTTLHFDWVISKGYQYPDGVGKWVYLVNGQFPGPNIEARTGDLVTIEVHNGLEDEGLGLHFHGLHMVGANHMDGVVGVTQKAIAAGGNFTYSFSVGSDQVGTFWWHSHSAFQRADGLYGAFVVHEPVGDISPASHDTIQYDDELLLLIGDWYHLPGVDIQATYDTYEYWGMEPVPDSLLINGHGAFNCSMATKSRPVDCVMVPSPQLVPRSGRSRVRVVNVGAMSGFTLKTPGRSMALLTVDGGGLVQDQGQKRSGLGVLYPGERVDIIVDWNTSVPDEDNHLEIVLDRENYNKKNLALTPKQSFPIKLLETNMANLPARASTPPPDLTVFDLAAINGTALPSDMMGDHPSQIVLIYTRVELLAHLGNSPKGFINRTYWEPQETPLIEGSQQDWDEHQLVPFIPTSQDWVDIVINNVDEKGHPFHLHGYDFYVVSSFRPPHRGFFSYNPFDTNKDPAGGAYNLRNPVRKDSIFVAGKGYVVLRIRPTNPGLWFLHCHILWHQGVGMAMTLHVGDQEA